MSYNDFTSPEQQQAFQEASQEAIRRGGLPLNAVARLTEQEKRIGTPEEFFTSDLSVNELALTRECGFEPLGQVMGSCVYNVGWQFLPSGSWVYSSQEFAILTQAHYDARYRAFDRLKQEAKLLKADGVVGVRFLRQGEDLWSTSMLEYIAIGTAVRRTDAPPAQAEPFVSNLNGQDHWKIRQEGYKPVGFVFGNCTWCQYPDWRSRNAMFSWSNAEMTSLTQGVYTARELAVSRMEAEARAVHAQGIVGVTVETKVDEYEDSNHNVWFIMTFNAFGTAIAGDTYHSEVKSPRLTVNLLDNTRIELDP